MSTSNDQAGVPPNDDDRVLGKAILALGLAAFLFHALTTASGLFWLDAGDFVTASCELGVPHPTGFPLYTLLGKLFCLLPVGSAAVRLSLLSAALAGVLTATLAWLLLALLPAERRRTGWVAASVVALVLWTTDVAGLMGRTPDVYALHALLVALAVCLLVRLRRHEGWSAWLLLGLVVGLGLSNHAEFRLFAPLLLGAAILMTSLPRPPQGVSKRGLRLLGCLGMVVVGLLPYLYLPLASRRTPYHSWGEPDTWERFWHHVSGLSIRLGFEQEFLSLSWLRLRHAAAAFGEGLVSDFGVWLLLLPLGLFWLLRRHAGPARLLLLLVLTDIAYAVAFNPMGLADDQNGATTYLVVALGVAVGADALLARLPARWNQRRAFGAALVATIGAVSLLGADWDRLLLDGSWGAEDLTFEALQEAPEGALILTGTEGMVAARVYLVGIGALRPDLQALNRSELSDSRLLVRRNRDGPFPLAAPEDVARWERWGPGAAPETYFRRLEILTETALAAGRAVLWEGGAAEDSAQRWDRIALGFPLHRLRAEASLPEATPLEALLPMPTPLRLDPWGARWLGHYLNYLGTYYTHRGHGDLALRAYQHAHQLRPDWASPLVNLGVLAARALDFEHAETLATAAVARDPLNTTAWLNLARYRCVLGHPATAWEAYRRAERLDAAREALDDVRDLLRGCASPN